MSKEKIALKPDKYPLIRQEVDGRDYICELEQAVSYPSKVDLRPSCPPVFEQKISDCTANAGVAAFMMLKKTTTLFSRMFLYFKERELEGTKNQDCGAQMRSIGKVLNQTGICLEKFFPYDVKKYAFNPSVDAVKDASTHRVLTYKKLNNITQIKQYISQKKLPVMIGMEVYSSFESAGVAKTGDVPIPVARESFLGGHAVDIVGYDDNYVFKTSYKVGTFLSKILNKLTGLNSAKKGCFIVRNSWSDKWGDKGYFYLPYSFMAQHTYDYWTIGD